VALSGGLTMVCLGLLFGFLALVGMAPVAPDFTKAYFHPFSVDTTAGLATVYLTILGLPNLVAQLVFFPTMNVCTAGTATITGGGFSFHGSVCALSWSHFPPGRSGFGSLGQSILSGQPISFPKPSPVYYLFILVPVATVLLGGALAARRARAVDRREAVMAGALAGVVFGVVSLLLAFVATMSLKITGTFEGVAGVGKASLGPDLLTALLFGLAWGVVGGSVGGFIQGRRLPAGRWRPQATQAAPMASTDEASGFTV
jgi:hypothetical protein